MNLYAHTSHPALKSHWFLPLHFTAGRGRRAGRSTYEWWISCRELQSRTYTACTPSHSPSHRIDVTAGRRGKGRRPAPTDCPGPARPQILCPGRALNTTPSWPPCHGDPSMGVVRGAPTFHCFQRPRSSTSASLPLPAPRARGHRRVVRSICCNGGMGRVVNPTTTTASPVSPRPSVRRQRSVAVHAPIQACLSVSPRPCSRMVWIDDHPWIDGWCQTYVHGVRACVCVPGQPSH